MLGGFKGSKRYRMTVISFSHFKKVFVILAIVIVLVMVKVFDSVLHQKGFASQGPLKSIEPPKQFEFSSNFLKIFHIDLKGAPPKIRFLLNIIPIIRQAGADAILIEYEDMFPFTGSLKNLSARNAYSLTEVKRFVEFAEALQIEVIPLVQTFGHLEYVLKLEEFQGLRELESFPQEICPLNNNAVDLVKEMIRQCMAVHPNAKHIHIGCDEVRHIGACSRCSGTNFRKLFASHVIKIADFVRSKYGVTPLIWDDMLRRWTFNDLSNSGLGIAVEPVVWVYGSNIFDLVPPFVWNLYQRTFPRLWVASAFKGAFGETETIPNLRRHFENHLSWMSILTKDDDKITNLKAELSGVFVTGWSRYDHFAVLCELLPVGIPSLILSLTFLDPKYKRKQQEGFAKWLHLLRCPTIFFPEEVHNENFFQSKLGNCSFHGSNLYSAVIQFQKLRVRVKGMMTAMETSGWTSRYNIENNFTSPWRLLEMFPEEGFAGEVLRKELTDWKSRFSSLMEQYYDKHTREEWEEQNVKPLEEKLREVQNNFRKLIERKSWPRRPLR